MKLIFEKRIVCDPKILGGKPVIYGTRISVEYVLELLQSGLSLNQILEEYPQLKRADLQVALAFSRRRVANEEMIPLPKLKIRS